MNRETLLLSSAYFPPTGYMALIAQTGRVLIEKEENFIKQTFRNRCYILTANGSLSLSVPVLEGSFHKKALKDIRIDYSKRWMQVHLRSILSSYKAAPYFEYFYDILEKIITSRFTFLIDLNMASLNAAVQFLKLKTKIDYSVDFQPLNIHNPDFRYLIQPKNSEMDNLFSYRNYIQVFSDRFGFVPGLSVIDLIFNTGSDAIKYLPDIHI